MTPISTVVARKPEPAETNEGCTILCKDLSETWFSQTENGNAKPTWQGYCKKKFLKTTDDMQ